MTPAPPVLSLSDAITAVEQAEAALTNAAAQTVNDQAAQAAAQAKADAAAAVVVSDQTDQQTAQAADVTALQALDTVIQARIAALQPPPAAQSAR